MLEHLRIAVLTVALLGVAGGAVAWSFDFTHNYKNLTENVARITRTLDRIDRFLLVTFPDSYED